ncbi:uncharacterized protein Z519_12565 [Cladophialophora bantiana CBS 173.52]|uniref:Xylanolytic transcriptional activator regulatory domain-containing protein n=1 Tax=Cladophialophora bantiana (strain ATCC 10958 / CBS 173.52 / CDC B-1940 / NIH 8579) TaxID=1442370 RepID=A0A0D2HQT0_CLAB1|nr:uncharacterized protein Z519_12565 [Cladophialophora bantiana CBS 173.52]KIW86779.1 hypothetical protein Z519_12565 [Cladophialophora bantiana CBS 173.52]
MLEAPPERAHPGIFQSQPLISIPQQYECPPQEECETSIDVFDNREVGQEDNSLYATDTLNFEYYGPRSMMSFYSQPAEDWVISKVKSPDYSSTVKRLVRESARMLKMSRGTLSTCREPEPPPEVAWQYANAYFEEGLDRAFGVVERTLFESRLRAHFSGTYNPVTDDKAWYALRNVVWAHGCRILGSKTRNFHQTLQASWAFFQNALSVHTETVFLHTSLMGVQALISMAYFSEGIGEVSLQYTLCTDALRLACSKGLHRQPSNSWKIPPHEVRHRNWIFWSIYCLEKQICSRSGRPSIMDDDEISCQVPLSSLSGRPSDTLYCHTLIKMMQLASAAKKRLSSVRALKQPTEQLLKTIRSLKKDLAELRCSVQQKICLDDPIDVSRLPGGLTLRQAQSLQSHYFCLVLDINTPLTYPWLGVSAYVADNMAAAAQVEASFNEVAQVSRSGILASRQINIDGGCSALIARYAPLYSFINLFIHILRDTTQSTVQSDLVLLDIALGYFSNLEFVTGLQLPRLFVRELCHFARLAVEHKEETQENSVEQINNGEIRGHGSSRTANLTDAVALDDTSTLPLFENDFFGFLPAEDLETWSTLIPFEEDGGLMI